MKLAPSAAILAALVLPFSASAKEETAAPQHIALKPIQFVEYDLPNGLHVILHENHAAPVIGTYVLYHVGSKNERADRTGFAHFFEHLMFEGSENIPRATIDKYISGAGGNLNASTSFDQTDYFFNLPSNELKLALWIESERMMHSKIDETGVETQRKVVKEEKRMRYDNQPYGSLFEELSKLVFAGTPTPWVPDRLRPIHRPRRRSRSSAIFTKPTICRTTPRSPSQATSTLENTKKLVEEYFGPIPRGADIKRPER